MGEKLAVFALGSAISGLWLFPTGRSKLSLWARRSPVTVLKDSVAPP